MIVMNIMAMMMTEMVVMIPIRTLLRSLAQESRMKIIQTRAQAYMKANPTETRLGVTNGRYSFRKNITSQADFQLNKAQQHRHHYRLCIEEEGKGQGPCGSLCCGLCFPTPPLWFPVLWFHVLPLPPVCQGLAWGGSYADDV